ncbi:helix-turn-helix domain-containing protein [Paenisporosarcina antarctica]|uniref:XRE family transcriptional regulator n=1 Tax=Paenisporosarcina antarctica TaxID=417367 RepID=A0A4P7A0W5_9BACL|nr:helix-turn-helix transcriptional regulator [Paenisporosarcina antarctica]QBP42640.1 XRE family transcriptional regulator [Paenisporosarcina antarctica]
MSKQLANVLKKRRRELGWTLKIAGEKSQSHPSLISYYEQDVRNPSLHMLKKLSKVYHLSYNNLLDLRFIEEEKDKTNIDNVMCAKMREMENEILMLRHSLKTIDELIISTRTHRDIEIKRIVAESLLPETQKFCFSCHNLSKAQYFKAYKKEDAPIINCVKCERHIFYKQDQQKNWIENFR